MTAGESDVEILEMKMRYSVAKFEHLYRNIYTAVILRHNA